MSPNSKKNDGERANCAPVAIFVYKRLDHLQKTIVALSCNVDADNTDLYIFSDGPKGFSDKDSVNRVRDYIKLISGFRSIKIQESQHNMGLAESIIAGVTHVCSEYGRVIVVEDDLVTSKWFLRFMNAALNKYQDETRIWSIHGYRYPNIVVPEQCFLLRGSDCWGWATWQRAWVNFESDGAKLLQMILERKKVDDFNFGGNYPYAAMLADQALGLTDSWAIRWLASAYLADAMVLYPGKNLVQNIGNDRSGTHSSNTDRFSSPISSDEILVELKEIQECPPYRDEVGRFLRSVRPSHFKRLASSVRRLLIRLRNSQQNLFG